MLESLQNQSHAPALINQYYHQPRGCPGVSPGLFFFATPCRRAGAWRGAGAAKGLGQMPAVFCGRVSRGVADCGRQPRPRLRYVCRQGLVLSVSKACPASRCAFPAGQHFTFNLTLTLPYFYRNCIFAQNCLVIHQKVGLPFTVITPAAATSWAKLAKTCKTDISYAPGTHGGTSSRPAPSAMLLCAFKLGQLVRAGCDHRKTRDKTFTNPQPLRVF